MAYHGTINIAELEIPAAHLHHLLVYNSSSSKAHEVTQRQGSQHINIGHHHAQM